MVNRTRSKSLGVGLMLLFGLSFIPIHSAQGKRDEKEQKEYEEKRYAQLSEEDRGLLNKWAHAQYRLRKFDQCLIESIAKGRAFDYQYGCKDDDIVYAATIDCRPDIIRILFFLGADVDHRNSDGETALMAASYMGKTDIVRILIAHGAALNLQARFENAELDGDRMISLDGNTALKWPSKYSHGGGSHESVVKLLLVAGADRELKDSAGKKPLDYALGYANNPRVRALLQTPTEKSLVTLLASHELRDCHAMLQARAEYTRTLSDKLRVYEVFSDDKHLKPHLETMNNAYEQILPIAGVKNLVEEYNGALNDSIKKRLSAAMQKAYREGNRNLVDALCGYGIPMTEQMRQDYAFERQKQEDLEKHRPFLLRVFRSLARGE